MITQKFSLTIIILSCLVPLPEKPNFIQEDFLPYRQQIPDTRMNFEMVPIPAGEFIMGAAPGDKSAAHDEFPRHKVALDAFWMGSHEVTWDVFELFLDKNYEADISENAIPAEVDGLTRPSTPYLDMTFGMGKDNKPAVAMTQYNAIQFCKWLYTKTGIFYRLPTEAEWEYAARAGKNTAYFFGDDTENLDDYAWHAGNSGNTTREIGLKKPNPWGLYDILGNVLEWTYDKYLPEYQVEKPHEAVHNPLHKADELYPRVLRGGHFRSQASDLRVSKRFPSTPVWKQLDPQIPKSRWWFPEAPFVGLRLVRPLETPTWEEITAYYDQAPIDDY